MKPSPMALATFVASARRVTAPPASIVDPSFVDASTARKGTAVRETLEQIDVIHRLIKAYPDVFELATTAGDVERIRKSGKIACLIGRLKPNTAAEVLHRRSHSVEVLGFGHTLARGMKAGTVVELAGAEEAIRQAIDLAERSAGMQLESVVVSTSAGKPGSELISASVNVAGKTVAEGDIARVLSAGSQHSIRPGRAVLH